MNDHLESELRAALRERASLVPAAAAYRLTGVDYHPRTYGLRRPVAFGAVASATAAAAVAVVISLGAGASNAFAGWTAKPTKAGPGQLAAASAACQQSKSSVAGLPLALADTRGPFTFAVYANSESTAACIEGPSFVSLSESQASSPVNVPTDRVLLSSAHRSERDGHAFGFTYGRTGTGVRAVTLVLDDGTSVQATVANGWFLAWWPSTAQLKAARLTTAAGTSTQTFNLPSGCNTNKDCPNGGSAHGSAEGGKAPKGGGFSMDGAGTPGAKQSGVSISQ